MRLQALLAALVLLSSSGCIMSMFVDPMGRRNAFDLAQRRYTQLVRWGEIEMAAEYVDPELRGQFRDQASSFEKLRITDFETSAVDFRNDSARVTVVYQAFALNAAVQAPFREHQEWYREGVSNDWRVRPSLEGLEGTLRGSR